MTTKLRDVLNSKLAHWLSAETATELTQCTGKTLNLHGYFYGIDPWGVPAWERLVDVIVLQQEPARAYITDSMKGDYPERIPALWAAWIALRRTTEFYSVEHGEPLLALLIGWYPELANLLAAEAR